jgi:enoyl-CoA hydratase/carnithine racemase
MIDVINCEFWISPDEYDGVVEIPFSGGVGEYTAQSIVETIKQKAQPTACSKVLFFNVKKDAAESIARVRLPGIVTWVVKYPQPIVFSAEGDVRDSGLELAMACDIRVASLSTMFGITQVIGGQMPNDGGVQLLTRLVGPGIATDMLLTGRQLCGDEALEFGLVNYLSDDPAAKAKELAITIASHGKLASKYVKEAVNAAGDLTFEQGSRLEADLSFMLHGTPEREAGLAAFRAGRDPQK